MVNKQENTESSSKLLDLPQQLTAGDLSGIMDVAPSAVIKELMRHGIMANINELVEFETAVVVAHEFGF